MKLSIITINYNNKQGLQKTIDSVISQTWKDYEWIIIDGGSTDGSKELIEEYQDHFSYWCSEPDKGIYNAMNKGIAKSKGDYLSFMNSGDCFYEPTTLEKIFQENLYGDMVYGDWVRIETDGIKFNRAPKTASIITFYTCNICHQAMLLKSTEMKQKGYDESYKVYADWARWMLMMLDNCTTQYIPVTICSSYGIEGLSSVITYEMLNELERIKCLIPKQYRTILDETIENNKILNYYLSNNMLQVVNSLMCERPLYCRLVHLAIIIIRQLKRILDFMKI